MVLLILLIGLVMHCMDAWECKTIQHNLNETLITTSGSASQSQCNH